MKGIGIFVAILLVGIGVAMYVTTRPPDRDLDAEEREWVDGFAAWRTDMEDVVDRAVVSIGVSRGERIDESLIPALEVCARTLAELGDPPLVLEQAHENAAVACGEVEYALALNEGFGVPALASTRQHLQRAGRLLVASGINLERQLEAD